MAGAIIFQSSSGQAGGGIGESVTVPHPAGLTVGDLMLAVLQSQGGTWLPPSGWILEGAAFFGTGNNRLSVFSKTAVAGDVAAGQTVFPVSPSSSARIGLITRWIGHNPAAPVNVLAFNPQSPVFPAVYTTPTVVTTVPNTTILRITGIDGTGSISGIVATVPPGTTQRGQQQIGGLDGEIRLAEENAVFVVPGATGTADYFYTGGSGTQHGHGLTVALAPLPPPSGGGPIGGFKGPFRIIHRRWGVLGAGV